MDLVDRHGSWRYIQDIPPATLLTGADVANAAGAVRAARGVLVQLQQPPPVALAVARQARSADRLVVLDGAPTDPAVADDLLAAADVLRADAREARLLTGADLTDADAALRAGRDLLRRGPRLVALAVDGVGNVFVWPDRSLVVPLSDTGVVDTTGAGDAFVAALTAGLLRGDEPEHLARYAVAAAGTSVGHPGGRPDLSGPAIDAQLARIPAT
ncbi:PfkB family carbohydrate kinase [Micromonospora sp. CPCC 206060]|uniref:PfkB family carbohydrate kinase n=1 Tax=Micromonospora sp. CPCC 206060 TaxID=3122406 RepID=UPI002FF2018F